MSELLEERSCPNCGKSINADATRCMYCFKKSEPVRRASIPRSAETAGIQIDPDGVSPHNRVATTSGDVDFSVYGASAMRRYRDAYEIAAAIVEHGQRVKTMAVLAATIIAILFMIIATSVRGRIALGAVIGGTVAAVLVYAVIHAHGVRLAAEGQHLLASLDVAVHTSPFLSETQRAQAMSL